MAGAVRVTPDLAAAERAMDRLDGLARRGSVRLMKEIGIELVQGARRRLGGTTAPDGSAWAPLSPAYEALRAARYPEASGMLKVRGILSRSLTYRAEPMRVQVGSPLIYAGVHQVGATIVPKQADALRFRLMGAGGRPVWMHAQSVRIPARPYLGIGPAEAIGIREAVGRAVMRALRASA